MAAKRPPNHDYGAISLSATQVMGLFDRDRLAELSASLVMRFPEGMHGVPPDQIAGRVRELVVHLYDGYGIRETVDVTRMVEVVAQWGWDFDQGSPGEPARVILSDTRVHSRSRRIDRLEAMLEQERVARARNARLDAILGGAS